MIKRFAILLLLLAGCVPLYAWDQTAQLPDKIVQMEPVPAAPDLVLAATTRELYRSTDAGLTWKRPGIAGHIQLAVHPASSRVYALASEDTDAGKRITLYLSRDFGASFVVQRRFDSLGQLVPRKIFLDPSRALRIYGVGTQGQALVSLDEGKKWRTQRAPDGVHVEQIYASPLNAENLYVSGTRINGGNSVLFISHDQGKTWDLLTVRPPACAPQRFYPDPYFARILVSSCDGTKTLASPALKTSSQLKQVFSMVSVPGSFASLFALNDRPDLSGKHNFMKGINGGDSWKAGDSLQGLINATVVLKEADRWVVAGTTTGTVYRAKLSSF